MPFVYLFVAVFVFVFVCFLWGLCVGGGVGWGGCSVRRNLFTFSF